MPDEALQNLMKPCGTGRSPTEHYETIRSSMEPCGSLWHPLPCYRSFDDSRGSQILLDRQFHVVPPTKTAKCVSITMALVLIACCKRHLPPSKFKKNENENVFLHILNVFFTKNHFCWEFVPIIGISVQDPEPHFSELFIEIGLYPV